MRKTPRRWQWMVLGVGFVIVDMRVRKLLKRFVASPMRRSDFLLALAYQ